MQLIFILISAFLQGISDPLIRKATQGIENIEQEGNNFFATKLIELKFLFTNFKVCLRKLKFLNLRKVYFQ